MKNVTLQTLITARALFEQAEWHCASSVRYIATAGLIVLQDAFELVLYAILVELEADEEKKIENLGFDEMLAEVGKRGVKVPKSATLKAMNKLRVTAKHYGQIMEPLTVQEHFATVTMSTDAMLLAVVGKPLREIFITELVGDVVGRPYLDEAVVALDSQEYLSSLIATRKAFYLEFEEPYFQPARDELGRIVDTTISEINWKVRKKSPTASLPGWTNHIHTPFDYIEIDPDIWRVDAIEWGINTQTLHNIRELTPDVVQLKKDEWHVRFSPAFESVAANYKNAASCLDLTIESIRRKYEHIRAAQLRNERTQYVMPKSYIGEEILRQPKDGGVIDILKSSATCFVVNILTGFQYGETYYEVAYLAGQKQVVFGFIRKVNADPLEVSDRHIFVTSAPGAW